MSPSRIFILRPVATSLLMVGILLVGAVAYYQLPVSALPQVDYPTIADLLPRHQTVLTAFQAVEDNLAALRILEQEAQVQDEAVEDAQKSVTLTTNQYKAGTVNYLNV